jgi:DNA primase catalytic subunit
MSLDKSTCLKYYKRSDIQELILMFCEDKEVAARYFQGFGKRPDQLLYPRDILELAKRGMTSLHVSEEHWDEVMQLKGKKTKKELQELRIGWDLILDIDCIEIEYSKISANLIIRFLHHCGVKDISTKFSGNKGFHIAVPFEAFPKEINGTATKLLFPEAARVIAAYIKDHIEIEMAKQILKFEGGDFQKIKKRTGVDESKLIYYKKGSMGERIPQLNVDSFIEIDTILIASRHLYRMPYSLHEKSGLISLPIPNNRILNFQKPMANPERFMAPLATFLNRTCKNGPTATNLVRAAYDYQTKAKEKARFKDLSQSLKEKKEKDYQEIEINSALTEEFFPPCIKLLLNGIEDGKKRALFSLINFLGKLGWTKVTMKKFLMDWNKKNPEPLREGYILGQLAHFNQKQTMLPPNCNNEGYYLALQVCKPDPLCQKINNPVNYSIIKYRKHMEMQEWIKEQEAKEVAKLERKKQKQAREARKHAKERAKMEKELAEHNLQLAYAGLSDSANFVETTNDSISNKPKPL